MQEGREFLLRRREAHVDDVGALLSLPLATRGPRAGRRRCRCNRLRYTNADEVCIGASERITPAHVAPCPQRSPCVSSSSTITSSPSIEMATDCWNLADQRMSVLDAAVEHADRAPYRLAPPHAQLRVTSPGHSSGSAIRSRFWRRGGSRRGVLPSDTPPRVGGAGLGRQGPHRTSCWRSVSVLLQDPRPATPTSFARRSGTDWPQASVRGRRSSGRLGCMSERFAAGVGRVRILRAARASSAARAALSASLSAPRARSSRAEAVRLTPTSSGPPALVRLPPGSAQIPLNADRRLATTTASRRRRPRPGRSGAAAQPRGHDACPSAKSRRSPTSP